jgi:hypothetical protein
VATQHPPDPVGRQADGAPAGLGQLGGDPGRPKARVAEGEGDHPLLDQGAGGVGHARGPPLTGPQELGAIAVELALPPVEVEGWIPMARQAARTLPNSAAIAKVLSAWIHRSAPMS